MTEYRDAGLKYYKMVNKVFFLLHIYNNDVKYQELNSEIICLKKINVLQTKVLLKVFFNVALTIKFILSNNLQAFACSLLTLVRLHLSFLVTCAHKTSPLKGKKKLKHGTKSGRDFPTLHLNREHVCRMIAEGNSCWRTEMIHEFRPEWDEDSRMCERTFLKLCR